MRYSMASRHAGSDKQNTRKPAESSADAHWHCIGQRSCVRWCARQEAYSQQCGDPL